MGSTASINYAASKKYKPSEPIEVKFDKVVKYDDGDEKPFKDGFQIAAAAKKQPLSLLASAIRILERRPRELPLPNGHKPKNYAKQVRPRSAYVVMKKPTATRSSSTLNSSHQSGSWQLNGMTPKMSQTKQLKTKQNLYMNLIHPTSVPDPRARLGMTVPSRTRTPMDYHLPVRQTKANTLPRYSAADGKRIRVNRKLYMDMIRPVMTSPQYLKLGASRSTLPTPMTHRTASRQSQLQQTRLIPRPPNGGQILRRRDPNLGSSHPTQQKVATRREVYRPHREEYVPVSQPLTPPVRSTYTGSMSNTSSLNRDIHLPRITRKTKDDVSLNSSLNSRSEIPRGHPDNITPLYFRKSLAYSPQYERKELLSNPLSSMNT